MKKIFISIAILITANLLANNLEIKTKIEQLPMIKKIGAKIDKVTPINSLYHIKGVVKGKNGGRIEGFVTEDFKNLVLGKVYNTTTGQELEVPYDIDVNALKNIAAYKIGNGKNEYFVFTDPECPYCQRLEKEMHKLKKDVTVYTILFPLNFHKNAKSMSRYILSQKDDKAKANAMQEIASKSKKYQEAKYSDSQRKKFDKIIQESLNITNKIGISGTPTILNSAGRKVSPQMILK